MNHFWFKIACLPNLLLIERFELISAEQSGGDQDSDRPSSEHLHLHQGFGGAVPLRDGQGPPLGHSQAVHCRGCLETSHPWLDRQSQRTDWYFISRPSSFPLEQTPSIGPTIRSSLVQSPPGVNLKLNVGCL